jgi:Domain of unknown function DUF302
VQGRSQIYDVYSPTSSPSDFEARMHTHEGTSGFMRFHTIDHGAWLAALGSSGKARMYTIGNPLIARTMIKHDLGVGLNVPVRIAVYEEPSSGKVRVTYNLFPFVPDECAQRQRCQRGGTGSRRQTYRSRRKGERREGMSLYVKPCSPDDEAITQAKEGQPCGFQAPSICQAITLLRELPSGPSGS